MLLLLLLRDGLRVVARIHGPLVAVGLIARAHRGTCGEATVCTATQQIFVRDPCTCQVVRRLLPLAGQGMRESGLHLRQLWRRKLLAPQTLQQLLSSRFV